MRQLFTLLITAIFVLASCKKDDTTRPVDAKLAGKWEMVSIKNNTTNAVITKPISVSTNIDIIMDFTSEGKGNISGVLTQETLIKGGFSVDQAKNIAIPSITLTYPSDNLMGSFSWDSLFSYNITVSEKYFYDSVGNLNISCRNNNVLTFIKQ